MSTYAIANAIERLAENFKKVMDDKNKIEREKLEFEKEKFKQITNQECDHDWELLDEWFDTDNKYVLYRYLCKKCGETKFESENGSRECEHDWVFDSSITNSAGTYIHYKCRKCGTKKCEEQ